MDKHNNEFWRDIPPIANVFKPDALPEVYLKDAAIDDERYYVPFSDTVSSRPLWISPSQNSWCDILMAKGQDQLIDIITLIKFLVTPFQGSGAIQNMIGLPLKETLFMKHREKVIPQLLMSMKNQ